MASDLSPDAESFIQQEIAHGAFHSRQEMLEAGMELLRKRKALLEKLDESRRQLDAGEFVEFDEDGLRDYFEGLKERATRRDPSL